MRRMAARLCFPLRCDQRLAGVRQSMHQQPPHAPLLPNSFSKAGQCSSVRGANSQELDVTCAVSAFVSITASRRAKEGTQDSGSRSAVRRGVLACAPRDTVTERGGRLPAAVDRSMWQYADEGLLSRFSGNVTRARG